MFSFLYLFAPGMISWLVRRHFSTEEKQGGLFSHSCEILAYAAIVMALTAAFLEPQGSVTVEVLENGMFVVRYGTKALVLSVALAAALGVCSAAGTRGFTRYRRRLFAAALAAAAALCILVYGTGAPAPDGMLRISTKPVRINNVFYESDIPIYVNESGESFIQVQALSQRLGIGYEQKRTGLFQTQYSLGGQPFTVNVLQSDNGYLKKDGELFISFSNLNQIEGIQVRNSQTLADGSLVAVHDLPQNKQGKPMTLKEFQKYKVQGKYTSLTFEDIALLMKKYPDMYLVTDSKETDEALITQQFTSIVETANETDPEILNRIIPQIYTMQMYDTIMSLYNWNSMIFTLYALPDFSEREVIDFAYQRGIGVITTHVGKNQSMFFHELYERDIKVYMHTYNTPEEEANLKRGIWGVYTDFLKP